MRTAQSQQQQHPLFLAFLAGAAFFVFPAIFIPALLGKLFEKFACKRYIFPAFISFDASPPTAHLHLAPQTSQCAVL